MENIPNNPQCRRLDEFCIEALGEMGRALVREFSEGNEGAPPWFTIVDGKKIKQVFLNDIFNGVLYDIDVERVFREIEYVLGVEQAKQFETQFYKVGDEIAEADHGNHRSPLIATLYAADQVVDLGERCLCLRQLIIERSDRSDAERQALINDDCARVDNHSTAKTETASADASKNGEKIPTSRDPLTQSLITHQFNEQSSGKTTEQINREFFQKHRRKLGKTDDEREAKFDTIKRNARRIRSNAGKKP